MIQLDPQLTFDETAHRYHLAGVALPSVTTVLAAAGLLRYDFLSDEHREKCLARGRAVHAATQRDDDHDFAEQNVNAEILGYVEAWRAFKRDFGFVPQLVECRVWNSQHRFAGTLDRTGTIRTGDELLVDIKSGTAPAATGVQLAAYASCLPHPRTRPRRSVELHQNGDYRVIAYETRDYQRDLDTFLAALEEFKRGEV